MRYFNYLVGEEEPMAGPEAFRHDGMPKGRLETGLPAFCEVGKLSNELFQLPSKIVREHPVETGVALSLVGVGVYLKSPTLRAVAKEVKEAIEGLSGRVAVGLDDAVMASRKTVRFPLTQFGRDDALYLDQPAQSALSKAYIRARQSVAQVRTSEVINGETQNLFGTSFAVSEDGKFLTNWHVAADYQGVPLKDISLVDRFGKEHAAQVISLDRRNDLAVLKLSRHSARVLFKPLQLGDGLAPGYHLNLQEEVYTFGHPAGAERLHGSVKSNVRLEWSRQSFYEKHGAAIIPIHTENGCSGSPLLNKRGEVTGIVYGGPAPTSRLHKSLCIAISSDHAKALLANPAEIVLPNYYRR